MGAVNTFFIVKARRPRYEYEPESPRRWMNVGVATEQEDGNILVRLNGFPLNFDGVLKLEVNENGKKSIADPD
jgi:hypothetical protein